MKDILVPVDLMQSASYLKMDAHIGKASSHPYAILDIDHFAEKNEDFNVVKITEKLKQMHKAVYEVFITAVTKEAIKAWE